MRSRILVSELVRYGENCKSAKRKHHLLHINVTEAVFVFTLNSEKMTLWITFHKSPARQLFFRSCFSCDGIRSRFKSKKVMFLTLSSGPFRNSWQHLRYQINCVLWYSEYIQRGRSQNQVFAGQKSHRNPRTVGKPESRGETQCSSVSHVDLVSRLLSECLHFSLLLTYGIVISIEQGIDRCIIIQDSQANTEHAQREGTVRQKGMCIASKQSNKSVCVRPSLSCI